eukprot:gene25583-30893_t
MPSVEELRCESSKLINHIVKKNFTVSNLSVFGGHFSWDRCYDLRMHHCSPTGKLLREWTEAELDNLIISYRAWYVDEDLPSEALRRVDQVVVGLQEHWADSIAVINFFFPWINFAHKFDYVKMPSKHRSLDIRASLPKQLIAVIEKHNACDLALYAKMEHSFAKQKRGVVLGV